MQEALQAAVMRMNSGQGDAQQPGPAGTIGAVMSIVNKLLQGSESSEELLEKLETLQKEDLTSLREQVQVLRKQCSRMLKSQEQLLEKVGGIQREQVAVSRAVLDLAREMARITLIDDVPAGEEDYEREPLPSPDSYGRAEFRANGDGRRR